MYPLSNWFHVFLVPCFQISAHGQGKLKNQHGWWSKSDLLPLLWRDGSRLCHGVQVEVRIINPVPAHMAHLLRNGTTWDSGIFFNYFQEFQWNLSRYNDDIDIVMLTSLVLDVQRIILLLSQRSQPQDKTRAISGQQKRTGNLDNEKHLCPWSKKTK